MTYSDFHNLVWGSIVEDKHNQLWLVRTKYKSGDIVLYCPESGEYTELHYSEVRLYNL